MARGNQFAFLEKGVVHLLVLSDRAILEIAEVRPLQSEPWRNRSHQVVGRLKDVKGVAMNMDKFRVWKDFENQLDSARMSRRLEYKRLFILE